MKKPFNLSKWIEENRSLLKPPVGNQQIYKENDDFIVMIVGGPNARKDFHYNESEELFYQLEGDITLRIQNENNEVEDIAIKEGDMFLLPSKVPHCPVRPANTIGLVIEVYRKHGQIDGAQWFCEKCNHKLFEKYFPLEDIVVQLPLVMNEFYESEELRKCERCGEVMEIPK